MSVFCRTLTFISNKFRFFASENAEFYFPFVVRSWRDEHTTNRLEAEQNSLRRALVMQRTLNEHQSEIFFFLFCPLFHSLVCPMFFLITPCFPQFFALVHLFLQKRKRVNELQNNLQTHITPNFTQMHIFQFVLFPICICIILNHLSPKIMYIQRKLRWNM